LEAPFFSIITPTYNRERFLGPCIESVQAQSYQNYEHIIVDDGSVDGTEQLVQSYQKTDPRIIYIKQENQGRSTARNVGIDAAKGSYVCFLDSDDLYVENHLETLFEAISFVTEPSIVISGLRWFFESEDRFENVIYRPRHLYQNDVEYMITNQFAPDCVCVPASLLINDKFNPDFYINEDVELWGRIAYKAPVITLKGYTSILRVHGGNTSKTVFDFEKLRWNLFMHQLKDPQVRPYLSDAFVADRKRGLRESRIRAYRDAGAKWNYLISTIGFIVRYPRNPSNIDKLNALCKHMLSWSA
jgi:glycosyltransferase involved in cell wall biosynthesis